MTAPRWARIREVVAQTLESPLTERDTVVRSLCGADDELRREVDALLAVEPEASFMRPPDFDEVLAPGRKRIAEFELQGELGDGGWGVVHRALDTRLGRTVALKVLKPGAALSSRTLERFRREARAAARLQHRGIVPVFRADEADGVHFIAMEYVPGTTLDAALVARRAAHEGRAFEPREAAAIARDVADALHFAHENGIIHRDVKPQNILLDLDRRPRLVDFGFARDGEAEPFTISGELGGSYCYMSPEQTRAKPSQLDRRTDVFSLGAVLYEMLTLQRAFDGRDPREVTNRVLCARPTHLRRLNPDVPRALETICAKALEKEPRHRYATAAAFADDLRRFLDDERVVAAPPALPRRVKEYCGRRARALLAVLGSALALVAGLALADRAPFTATPAARVLLSVRSDADGDRVVARRFDPRTGLPGPREVLGHTPLVEAPLDDGFYRIEVHRPGRGAAERPLFVDAARHRYELDVRVHDVRETTRDMVRIDGGDFQMGEPGLPFPHGLRTVHVEPFWIDPFEVSNGQYREFIDETGRAPPRSWSAAAGTPGFDDLPVTGVAFEDADAYAASVGKRLLTAAEWELAARGLERRTYPWGSEAPRASEACMPWLRVDRPPSSIADYLANALPVRSCPELATKEGLHHLATNVVEWTASPEVSELDGVPRFVPGVFVQKGGSWWRSPGEWSLSHTYAPSAQYVSPELGFRCARSVTEEG